MRIGIAQIETRPGDLTTTGERICSYASAAAVQGVDLLLFSAGALTGFQGVRPSDQQDFDVDVFRCLCGLSERVSCPCVIPVYLGLEDSLFADVALVADGRVRLLNMEVDGFQTGETPERPVAPGSRVLSYGGRTFQFACTLDEYDAIVYAGTSADVVVLLDSEGASMDDPMSLLGAALEENSYADDAANLGSWVVGVASLGVSGESVSCGGSFVLSPTDGLVAVAPAFEEHLLVAPLEEGAAVPDTRPERPVLDERLFLWQLLTLGIKGLTARAGAAPEVVLALDGTLSSQVLAILASDALGPTHVHALLCAADAAGQRASDNLVTRLRVDSRRSEHARTHGASAEDVLESSQVEAQLAAWAAELDGVVLSSQDKTALALGLDARQATAAFVVPLYDVYRSDLLTLAHFRNTISPVIPHVALMPADLPDPWGHAVRGAQEREERLSAIDRVLAEYLENARPIADVIDVTGFSREFVLDVLDALDDANGLCLVMPHTLATGALTLREAVLPTGMTWRDGAHAHPGELQATLSDLVERHLDRSRQQEDATDAQTPPDGATPLGQGAREDVARQMSEALSLLRDFAQAQGLDISVTQRELGETEHDGRTDDHPGWRYPFSEN